jgi:hypothetical protein
LRHHNECRKGQAVDAAILRLFRFRPGRPAFDQILRDRMIPELLTADGLAGLYVGRQGPDELGERIVASIWSSFAQMRTAVGESFDAPVFHPELLDESVDRRLSILPLALAMSFAAPDQPAILRVVDGEARRGELAQYIEEVRCGTLADVEREAGPHELYAGAGEGDRFVTLSAWSHWSELQRATGATRDEPIATRHRERLTRWQASHYELVFREVRPDLAADRASLGPSS